MAHFHRAAAAAAAAAGRRTLFATAGAATVLLGGGMALAACKEEQSNPPHRHKVLIVGGGSAGLAVAAQLRNKGVEGVAVVEPSFLHYYQPLWTLVGGGIFPGTKSVRPEKPLIPGGVQLIQDRAEAFDPQAQTVTTAGGKKLGYDYLVVAAGLQINWGAIKGLPETIGKNGVVSVYDYEYAQDTWAALQAIKKGRMVFTQPSTAVKCGGAPQKIMWLAEEHVRQAGTRDDFEIFFSLPQQKMFGVQKYSDTLEKLAQARGIQRLFGSELVEVDGTNKSAVFKKSDGSKFCLKFDLLHVVPPMGPPDFIRRSPLANKEGYVDVDQYTLQHAKHPNVFAIGDCSSLPTSKTIAAITAEAPVLVHNLLRVMEGKQPTARYDGYTSCPLVTGYSSLLLAEFKYGGEPAETFAPLGIDQAEPRWAFLQMKKYVFPAAYWELFLRGRWYGSRGVIPPSFDDKE